MKKDTEIRVDFGDERTRDFSLIDDGRHISRPSDWPTGGARIILASTGEMDIAMQRAHDQNWPYWIGGCGFRALPKSISIIK